MLLGTKGQSQNLSFVTAPRLKTEIFCYYSISASSFFYQAVNCTVKKEARFSSRLPSQKLKAPVGCFKVGGFSSQLRNSPPDCFSCFSLPAVATSRVSFLIPPPQPKLKAPVGCFMAGEAGFEPTRDGVKVRCLTAWLLPNNKNGVGYQIRTDDLECHKLAP